MPIRKTMQSRAKVREPSGTGEASAWWHAWPLGRWMAWAALIVLVGGLVWWQWT